MEESYLHGLHVGVGQHGGGHVHQCGIVEEVAEIHPARSSHAGEHPWKASRSRSHPGLHLVLGNLEVGLVALVIRLQLQRLLEVVNGFLVLVETAVSEAHPAISLAVARVHVDGSLAVLYRQVVVIHLTVGGRPVTVEHGVGPVEINGLKYGI